jgi:hypothetical protein
MKYKVFSSILVLSTSIFISCSLIGGSKDADSYGDDFLEEISASFTADLLSKGFEFCPDSYLNIEIEQTHEIARFNYMNYAHVTGQLPLKPYGSNEKSGLKADSDIELTGEGWVGVCKFQSSGSISYQLQARLIPGETAEPHLMIVGQCESAMTTKPPCGDFGMMPLEKAVHVIIPYRDGESTEWEWENRAANVSGKAIWTLHIPCE